jgi:1,4-dihydroxy-2-naphthoate octaprenyltransferase
MFKAWVKASRLPAQTFIFPSLLLGQMLYQTISGSFSWFIFSLLFFLGLTMHFYIVYANDYADYETDQHNMTFTPFTGGSRVLVEGDLGRASLLQGAIFMAFATLLLSGFISLMAGSIWPVVFAIVGLALLHAYSFYPIRLSYRGFGETLQMLGVGVVLPIIAFAAQGGALSIIPWSIVLVLLPSQLAMAIGTALPDAPSDIQSQKRTSAVLFGNVNAQRLMLALFAVSFTGLSALLGFNGDVTSLIMYGLFGLLFTGLTILTVGMVTVPGSKEMVILTGLSIFTNTLLVLATALVWL